jgi:pyridoxamine 5'-phosphate oxidase family protein
MPMLSKAELAYLTEERPLGRLATVDRTGQPHNVPVGWVYNAELDTVDIGGRDLTRTGKFQRIKSNPLVCLVIDDVLPPWHPRCVQIRGHAEALDTAAPGGRGRPQTLIRISPTKIVSWGLEPTDRR